MGIRAAINRQLARVGVNLNLHWQNLDDRPGDWLRRSLNSSGRLLLQGRAWASLWDAEGRRQIGPGVRFEWDLHSTFTHMYLHINADEGEVTLAWAIPPVALWWSVDSIFRWLHDLGPWEDPGGMKAWDKYIGASAHDGSIFWNLGYSEHHWTREMPYWRHGSFDVVRFLFGDTEHSEESLKGPIPVEIPMPERSYKGTVELRRETWKRPRLPWNSTVVVRAHIETDKDPIPHPGKGENSWDCGEDATYGLTCQADTVAEAISKMVGTVMRSRERHGGLDWRPEEDHRPKEHRPPEPPAGQEAPQ